MRSLIVLLLTVVGLFLVVVAYANLYNEDVQPGWLLASMAGLGFACLAAAIWVALRGRLSKPRSPAA
jgi:hypothetical protein